jgi:CheY-like chemotaxis protein
MKVLIVEDDSYKYREIEAIVQGCSRSFQIEHTDNVYQTINYLKKNKPDRIILDMSLPSHPGRPGEGNPLPMPDGGIEVILELRSLGCSSIPIIVITQYPGIEIESSYYSIDAAKAKIGSLYGIENLFVAKHSSEDSDWEVTLQEFLEL